MRSGGKAIDKLLGVGIERIESDRVECELAFDTKVVSADLAHFFLDPIS